MKLSENGQEQPIANCFPQMSEAAADRTIRANRRKSAGVVVEEICF